MSYFVRRTYSLLFPSLLASHFHFPSISDSPSTPFLCHPLCHQFLSPSSTIPYMYVFPSLLRQSVPYSSPPQPLFVSFQRPLSWPFPYTSNTMNTYPLIGPQSLLQTPTHSHTPLKALPFIISLSFHKLPA